MCPLKVTNSPLTVRRGYS